MGLCGSEQAWLGCECEEPVIESRWLSMERQAGGTPPLAVWCSVFPQDYKQDNQGQMLTQLEPTGSPSQGLGISRTMNRIRPLSFIGHLSYGFNCHNEKLIHCVCFIHIIQKDAGGDTVKLQVICMDICVWERLFKIYNPEKLVTTI